MKLFNKKENTQPDPILQDSEQPVENSYGSKNSIKELVISVRDKSRELIKRPNKKENTQPDSMLRASEQPVKNSYGSKNNIKKLVISAMLVAIGVVLGRITSIPVFASGNTTMYIGFGPLPIMLICCMYGPIWGMTSACAWDLIGAILFPQGAFNPAFSVTAAIFGLVLGLFFMKPRKISFPYMLLACTVSQMLFSVILNTLLLVIFYSLPWQTLLLPRVVEQLVMIPLNTTLLMIIMRVLKKHGFIEV